MKSRKQKFEASTAQLRTLEQEHASIHRRFLELDNAILHGHGSPRILETARELAIAMKLHMQHEDLFQQTLSYVRRDEQKLREFEVRNELSRLEEGLKLDEVYSALRLRALCKSWMQEHMYLEKLDIDLATVAARTARRHEQVRRAAM